MICWWRILRPDPTKRKDVRPPHPSDDQVTSGWRPILTVALVLYGLWQFDVQWAEDQLTPKEPLTKGSVSFGFWTGRPALLFWAIGILGIPRFFFFFPRGAALHQETWLELPRLSGCPWLTLEMIGDPMFSRQVTITLCEQRTVPCVLQHVPCFKNFFHLRCSFHLKKKHSKDFLQSLKVHQQSKKISRRRCGHHKSGP